MMLILQLLGLVVTVAWLVGARRFVGGFARAFAILSFKRRMVFVRHQDTDIRAYFWPALRHGGLTLGYVEFFESPHPSEQLVAHEDIHALEHWTNDGPSRGWRYPVSHVWQLFMKGYSNVSYEREAYRRTEGLPLTPALQEET